VLPRAHRITEPTEIRRLSRGGQRINHSSFVARAHQTDRSLPSRFGFVVSKQVGGAVARNLVKRRLRALAQEQLKSHPVGWDVIVRALPPAAATQFVDMQRVWREGFSKAMVS